MDVWISGIARADKLSAIVDLNSRSPEPGVVLTVDAHRLQNNEWEIKVSKRPAMTHINDQPIFRPVTEQEVRAMLL